VDAEYRWPLNARYEAFAGADVNYQSRTNGALGDSAILAVKAYALLDLRAGLESSSGRWKLSLWGRNITNTYYYPTAIRDNDTVNRYAGLPATYGVTLNFRFN
jgi:outer membrane receptor protein involved in Fe transport